MRLDQYLTEQNLTASRSKAQALIKEGNVKVDGKIVISCSHEITTQQVELLASFDYVGRGGYKLRGFLDDCNIDVEGKKCLDIGSSSGGFTQELLRRGAKSVTCVDVGSDQLDQILRNDERITLFEQTDIKNFKSDEQFELVVCDLSFVSSASLFFYIDKLSSKDIVVLFKPQFEVGKAAKRTKKGVVINQHDIETAKWHFEAKAKELGWKINCNKPSDILGKEGNLEQFYYFSK